MLIPLLAAGEAEASVTFNATGVPSMSVYVTFADDLFDRSSNQILSNAAILNLAMTVPGETCSLASSRHPRRAIPRARNAGPGAVPSSVASSGRIPGRTDSCAAGVD